MEAKELRIGNFVNFNDDGEIKQIKVLGIDLFGGWNSVIYDENIPDIEMCDIEPIPLTEEWIFNFGVKIEELNLPYSYEFYCNNGYLRILRDEKNRKCTRIKYVHQLQNLYFALTGEELTLK